MHTLHSHGKYSIHSHQYQHPVVNLASIEIMVKLLVKIIWICQIIPVQINTILNKAFLDNLRVWRYLLVTLDPPNISYWFYQIGDCMSCMPIIMWRLITSILFPICHTIHVSMTYNMRPEVVYKPHLEPWSIIAMDLLLDNRGRIVSLLDPLVSWKSWSMLILSAPVVNCFVNFTSQATTSWNPLHGPLENIS